MSWHNSLLLRLARIFHPRRGRVDQLTLVETRYPQEGLLFSLSGDGGLSLFREVILVADGDGLVRAASALVEDEMSEDRKATPEAAASESWLGRIFKISKGSGKTPSETEDYIKWWCKTFSCIIGLATLVCVVIPWLNENWLPELGPLTRKRWPRFVRLIVLGLVLIRVKLRALSQAAEDTTGIKNLMKQQNVYLPEGTQEGDSVEKMMAVRGVAVKKFSRLRKIRRVYADIPGASGDDLSLLLPIRIQNHPAQRISGRVNARRRALLRTIACSYVNTFASYAGQVTLAETEAAEGTSIIKES